MVLIIQVSFQNLWITSIVLIYYYPLGATIRGPRMSCYVKYFTGDIEGIYFPNDEIEYLSMVVYFWHAHELTAKRISGSNIMVGIGTTILKYG